MLLWIKPAERMGIRRKGVEGFGPSRAEVHEVASHAHIVDGKPKNEAIPGDCFLVPNYLDQGTLWPFGLKTL